MLKSSSTGHRPNFCDPEIFQHIFQSLRKDPAFLHDLNSYLFQYQRVVKDEFEYTSAQQYYADRKRCGILACFPDMDGHMIRTRSEQEKKICEFLSMNNVKFRYEEPYIVQEIDNCHHTYRPDFTIHYEVDRKKKVVYLEHFGIDENGNVPRWFGDGKAGGWQKANYDYSAGIVWKRNLHKRNGTTLVETTSADFVSGTIYSSLREKLERLGVVFSPMTDEEAYKAFIHDNSKREAAIIEMMSSFVNLMKASCIPTPEMVEIKDEDSVMHERNSFILKKLITPFFQKYQLELASTGKIDFTDAILMATQICNEGERPDYDYILVDEFQDISMDRYRFLQSLRREDPLTKLFCVGDDWQSIYRFAGSNLSLFKDFEKFFGKTAECKMETTFRFGEPLISLSSDFILQNPIQKSKSVRSFNEKAKTGIYFFPYKDTENLRSQVAYVLDNIPRTKSVYILGRYSFDIDILKSELFDIRTTDRGVSLVYNSRQFTFLTAHQSKGLEADFVILLNANSGTYGFPSTMADDPVLAAVLSEDDEYPFGEERRLFYVATTRAKAATYVLYNSSYPSTFVTEILNKDIKDVNRCPVCHDGHKVVINRGNTKTGNKFKTFVCSNNAAGCPYMNTEFYS